MMGNERDNIKSRIRAEKKKNGQTNESISELLGISPEHFSRIINGKYKLQPEQAKKLADLWGVTPEYILGISNYRTEKDLLEAVGVIDTENYQIMLAFITSLGIHVRIQPSEVFPELEEEIGREETKQDGLPIPVDILKYKDIGMSETDAEEFTTEAIDAGFLNPSDECKEIEEEISSRTTSFHFLDTNTARGAAAGDIYIADPEQAAIIFEQFKELARASIVSLLKTSNTLIEDGAIISKDEMNNGEW